MYTHRTIAPGEVHDFAHVVLLDCLKVRDYGRTCPASTLIALLLFAATRAASLSAACRRLAGAPSDETARMALLATLPDQAVLERKMNAGLRQALPKALWKRKRTWPVAVDLCDLPYHGQPLRPKVLRRGGRKQGTTRFHTYATAFVVRKGYRFTLASTLVLADETLAAVSKRLLGRVSKLGIRTRYVLLDRAFYAVDVVRYLQQARRAFVMPVAHRGRTPKDPSRSKSTRRFLMWRRGGWSSHTWEYRGQRATVQIGVARRAYTHRQQRQHQMLVFAFWGFRPCSLTALRQTYRKRFAIETSFRQVNQARIRTSTRDPQRRFLFVAIALILRNIWALVHLIRLASQGHVRLESLPFVDMLHAMQELINLLFRCITAFGLPKPDIERTHAKRLMFN